MSGPDTQREGYKKEAPEVVVAEVKEPPHSLCYFLFSTDLINIIFLVKGSHGPLPWKLTEYVGLNYSTRPTPIYPPLTTDKYQ